MGQSGKKAAKNRALQRGDYWDKIAQEQLAKMRSLGVPIEELANMFIQFGLDPTAFLASPQGQALLAPLQQATARNFEGARVSLADQMAGSGMNNPAPFGNLLSQEAGAQSQNVMEMIRQSLGLGQTGANMLQGQQQIANPWAPAQIAGAYNTSIFSNQYDPWKTVGDLLGALAGA